MATKPLLFIAVAALALHGCAVALLGAGAGAGVAGAQYAESGKAAKTYNASLAEVRDAATKALDRMDLPVKDDMVTEQGRRLTASTADRTVEVNIENVTYTSTRLQVEVTRNGSLVKDSDTASAIVDKTSQILEAEVPWSTRTSNATTVK
jgi:hypothetical protein